MEEEVTRVSALLKEWLIYVSILGGKSPVWFSVNEMKVDTFRTEMSVKCMLRVIEEIDNMAWTSVACDLWHGEEKEMNLSKKDQKNMHYSSELKFMRKSCPGNHKDINKPVKIGEISQWCEKRLFQAEKN